MNWTRVDDVDDLGRTRVRYTLDGYTFEIRATKDGVQLTGETPYYTDWVYLNERITWAQYLSQRLKETGHTIPQTVLDRGEL